MVKSGMCKKKQPQDDLQGSLRQLALPFTYYPRFVHSDFISARSNIAARMWLGIHQRGGSKPEWPEQRMVLWGEGGTGKTHLLQIWAEKEQALFLPASAVVQDSLIRLLEKVKDGQVRAFVLDDADLITDSYALLHLLNLAKEQAVPVVLGGRAPPARWNIRLPDLDSRLRATMTVRIDPPEEELLRILLLRLLAERQLVVSSSLIEWIMIRLPRTAAAVREIVRRFDHVTLALGEGITRNLASEVIADLFEYEEET